MEGNITSNIAKEKYLDAMDELLTACKNIKEINEQLKIQAVMEDESHGIVEYYRGKEDAWREFEERLMKEIGLHIPMTDEEESIKLRKEIDDVLEKNLIKNNELRGRYMENVIWVACRNISEFLGKRLF